MSKINVLSLFDGISGCQQALTLNKTKIGVYYSSEICKKSILITDKKYPKTVQMGDVNKITDNQFKALKKIDLLCAGFPCQSYSISGTRKGLNSKNGQLIYQVFRAIEATQPSKILLENVRGLLSIHNGQTFIDILKELNNLGYVVDFKLINAGLLTAQNRMRIYIVCKKIDTLNAKKRTIEATKNAIYNYTKGIINTPLLSENVIYTYDAEINQPENLGLVMRDILIEGDYDYKPYTPNSEATGNSILNVGSSDTEASHQQQFRVYSEDGKSPTITTNSPSHNAPKVALKIIGNQDPKKSNFGKKRSIYSIDNKSPTPLYASHKFKHLLIDDNNNAFKYRTLCATEYERLQGIKDDYTKCDGVTDNQRKKAIGNGFAIPIISHIFKSIIE